MNAIAEAPLVAPSTGAATPPAAKTSTSAAPTAAASMPAEYLSFRLGGEEYGIDILRVQEIRSYEEPTRIAQSAPFMKGVVNLRGVIVPIIDLRLKLQCPSAEYNAATVVIVLSVGGRVVGVVVDAVSDVLQLAATHIKAAPQMASNMGPGCITGIGSINDRMLILLDIQALLAGPEVGLLDAA